MDKLHAIHIKEQQRQIRFKETLRLRNELLSLKTQIDEAENDYNVADETFKNGVPKVYDLELEVKTLEAQVENMEKHIREKVMVVLNLEESLKQSKMSFENNMRHFIEMSNNLIKEDSIAIKFYSSGTDEPQNDDSLEIKRQVWTLQGEIEAMTFFEEVQRTRIEEIEKIKELVGEPFQGEMEDNAFNKNEDK